MKTLKLRVQQQNSTAQRMAEVLEAHPKVLELPYNSNILIKYVILGAYNVILIIFC